MTAWLLIECDYDNYDNDNDHSWIPGLRVSFFNSVETNYMRHQFLIHF